MARLLVTGGAGFIGSNFVHHRLAEHPGDRVVVLDALTYSGNIANLDGLNSQPEFAFVRGDIRDVGLLENILFEEQVDTIVHFAAESHVDRSICGPDVFVDTNIVGTHALLKAARRVWLDKRTVERHRFHQVSTDEVFGSLSPEEPAFDERSGYSPNSPYSASKAAADHLVRAYHMTFGLETTISNCSNNYGPFHFPEKLIPLSIVNILCGRAIPIYGDGRNVRDWLHVGDHCRAIDLILSEGVSGEVYCVGGGAETENLQLVGALCEIADEMFGQQPELRLKYPACPAAIGERTASLISFVRDRPGHDRRYAIHTGKIERDVGYRPQVSLRDGLRETFAWYIRNERWWRSVMDGRYRQWIQSQYRPETRDIEQAIRI